MDTIFPLPKVIWDLIPPAAQAAIRDLVQGYEQRLQALQRQVEALQQRLGQNSSNSSRPPSSDGPRVKRRPPQPKTGRKRGAQPGHTAQQRPLVPPEQVDQVVPVKPTTCRRCHRPLQGVDPQPLRHQVAEIPPLHVVVTEYQLHRLTCPACATRTCAPLPAGVPAGAFGPRLQALLATLAGAYRLGQRPIRQLAADVFGLSISLGMIAKLQRHVADVLEPPVRELRDYVRTQSANVDETGWREASHKAWLWTAVTPLVTVFLIAGARSARVLRDLLGVGYGHVVTCDRWKAYRGGRWVQWCWAHLRRDFQAMIDRGGPGKDIGTALLEHSDHLFTWWHRVRDGTLSRATLRTYVGWLRSDFRDDLERGAACDCAKTAATCRDLLAHESWLWTFIWRDDVEPTNNAAERAVRHAVLWRKTSGGTASADGSRFVERVLSVVATCRQQSRNVLEYLSNCCEAQLHGQAVPSLLPQANANHAVPA
jgi:transposase